MWQAVEVLWLATVRVRVLQAPAGRTLLGSAGEDRQQGAPQSKTFRSGLCAGYRRWLQVLATGAASVDV